MKNNAQYADQRDNKNNELTNSSAIITIAVIVIGVAMSIILGIYISRMISRPINEVNKIISYFST